MSLRNTSSQWGAISKAFHWVMALGILGNGIWGLLMTLESPSMTKIKVYALHKSIGLTLLALLILRLAWRAFDRRPDDEPGPYWQQLAAHAVHGLLYLLAAAIPLSGWWFNSAHGYPLQWFKLFSVPALGDKNDALASWAHAAHEYLFWLLIVVLVAHIGAALKHHAFDQDNVLRRMLPFARPREKS